MSDQREGLPFYAKSGYRLFSGGFGLLLISIGFYILLSTDLSTLLRIIVGAVFLLFGLNAVISAYKAKAPWLSRLGPLP